MESTSEPALLDKELADTLSVRTNLDGAFASTAYYLDPNVKTPLRGHLGYDLVFDVDVKVRVAGKLVGDVCFRRLTPVDILVDELALAKTR